MEHLTVLNLTIQLPDSFSLSKMRVASLGPFFQGALMEQISSSYAARLHEQSFNPYSLRCLPGAEDHTMLWQVVALTDDAAHELISPLVKLDAVHLKSAGVVGAVVNTELTKVSLKSLTDIIAADNDAKVHVYIDTPTAFKQAGNYEFMPTVRLMFQNLLMRYYAIYEGSNEVDQDTLSYISEQVRISSFNIRSQYFSHAMGQGRKVPAFVGSLNFSIRGPSQLKGLCWMLLKFGEYAGVGIKTSMGMGAMRCLQKTT